MLLFVTATPAHGAVRFAENFDGASAKGLQLYGGAKFATEERRGGVLMLDRNSYGVVERSSAVKGEAGTIQFWIRPHWDESDQRSHVFLTARWNDRRDGYMAISHGWWEPSGSGRLYFIVNNQELIHCSTPYTFERDAWALLTVTWQSGASGYCRLFVDGAKVAESLSGLSGNYSLADRIYIGSDKGATNPDGRAASFDMDEIRIDDRPWSEREITAWHQSRYRTVTGKSYAPWDKALPPSRQDNMVMRDGAGNPLEARVIFDEDIHWAYSRRAAETILARVKAAGFNVYVPCVWHGRGTHFPSAVTAADERLAAAIANGYDPLKYLIEQAHALGIEVHPWFTVVRREWPRYQELHGPGVPENAYDIHDPRFRDFIVDMMLDMVERYDVDGINLDYIRAMGICNSVKCKNEYEKRSGHDLTSDIYLSRLSGAARKRIQDWQTEAVSDVVRRLSEGARRIKPGLVISVDGNPVPARDQHALEGRDEILWANKRWIDLIFNMDYRQRVDLKAIDMARGALEQPEKLYPLFGNFDSVDGTPVSRPGKMVENFVEMSRDKWPGSGVGFYIFQMLSDDQVAVLKQGAFAEQAIPGWRARPTRDGNGWALQR